jgi:Uma2 family endonuclease
MAISTESLDVIDGVYYPSSDGKPMAESDLHIRAMILLLEALQDAVRRRPLHYVAANILWYWQQGNPRSRCSPDVMVVRGVEDRPRRSFRSWQENAVPCVVFEISSKKTWRTDLNDKPELYARLGVHEYFLFDPEDLYLEPPLRGFRLEGEHMIELQPAEDGSLLCQELNLRLRREGSMLRLIRKTGKPILTRQEDNKQERQRAKKAEAEVKRLEQIIANLNQQRNGGTSK